MTSKLDEAGDHVLLLSRDVQDDVELINDVAYLALELGFWRDVQKSENDCWVDLVFDAGLIDVRKALRELPKMFETNGLFVCLTRY